MENLHIGTSGWSYKDWKGVFYPEGVGQRRFLPYYATQFDCAELNATFYRLPSEKMVQNWRERTPESFRFCPKLSRFITHRKRLQDVADPLGKFFERIQPLSERLGPILIQLPPNLEFDAARVEDFFKILRDAHGDHRFTLEARDDSWMAEAALELMGRYRITWVIAHSGSRFPYREAITADTVYLRFHGPEELYASEYSQEMLADYAGKLVSWLEEGRSVWTFFNNTEAGCAPKNARQLRELVQSALS